MQRNDRYEESQQFHLQQISQQHSKHQLPELNQFLQPSISKQITFKVKDGLYLATSIQAFKDEQFILLNWIGHVIVFQNCQCPFDNSLKKFYAEQQDTHQLQQDEQVIKYLHCNENLFTVHGIKYNLAQLQNQFQQNSNNCTQQSSDESFVHEIQTQTSFNQIINFIEESQQNGSSCLIITSSCDQNINDSGCIFSISTFYLMIKYKWSLFKTLEYMNSRIKGISINQVAYQFLSKLQIHLLEKQKLTYDWKTWTSTQQIVLRNTYLNSMKNIPLNSINSKSHISIKSNSILKNHRKFQNVNRKVKTEHFQPKSKQLKQLVSLKSILKEQSQRQTVKCRKKKVQINLFLNNVKQYHINANELIEDQEVHNSLIQLKSNFQDNKNENNLQQNSCSPLTGSRSKKISLCVSKIISKFKQQNQQKYKNNSSRLKSLFFDNFYTINSKKLKSSNNQSLKPLDQNNSVKKQILRIIEKMKDNNRFVSSQNDKATKQNFEAPKTRHIHEGQKKQVDNEIKYDKSNTNSLNLVNVNSCLLPFGNANLSKNDEKNKISLDPNKSLQSNDNKSYREKALKNEPLSKQKTINISYIKEAKGKQVRTARTKQKQNIDLKQNKKQENLIIEYEDFKQIINKKHNSVCSVYHRQESDKVQNQLKQNMFTRVVEELKKNSSYNNLSRNLKKSFSKKIVYEDNVPGSISKRVSVKWR